MVQWLFEDYRQDNSWVAFDDHNQQVLETAWQTISQSRPSTPDPKEPFSEESLVEIEDSHFQGLVSVSPSRGFAYCDAGDLVIDRVDNETGFREHEWIVHELLKWREELEFDEDDTEDDVDSDKLKRRVFVRALNVPIGHMRQFTMGDEGYGSYESKTNLPSPKSEADTQKYV